MTRFIAQLLILSLFTLNIAWAVDDCALAIPGEAGGLTIQIDAQPSTDQANAGLDCDVWCHAWANPIDLPAAVIADGCNISATINGGFYILSYFSLPIPPPFHPPIA